MADNRGPHEGHKKTGYGKQGNLVLYNETQQLVGPHVQQNFMESTQQSLALKAPATSQHQAKLRKPIVARNPVQPGSFMASARGASRVGTHQEEAGPKKRSRTDTTDDDHNDREGQQPMSGVNNPNHVDKTAEPGKQACRGQ